MFVTFFVIQYPMDSHSTTMVSPATRDTVCFAADTILWLS
jgi:hypothetical protein